MSEQPTVYYWYTSNQTPPWNKLFILADGSCLYGYPIEPSEHFIERFYLRFFWEKSWEEMKEF